MEKNILFILFHPNFFLKFDLHLFFLQRKKS